MADYIEFNDVTEIALLENNVDVRAVRYVVALDGAENVDGRLGAALRTNTRVEALLLGMFLFHDVEDSALILQFVGSSATLRTLMVEGGPDSTSVSHFVRAVTTNNSIEAFCMHRCTLPAEQLADFVRQSTVRKLIIWKCDILLGSLTCIGEAAAELARAFEANTSLTLLSLSWTPTNATYLNAILPALSFHSTLVMLSTNFEDRAISEATAVALGGIIRSTIGSLLIVDLSRASWTARTLAPIASAFLDATRSLDVRFSACRFDEPSSHLLVSMLQSVSDVPMVLSFQGFLHSPESADVLSALAGSGGASHTLYVSRLESPPNWFESLLLGLIEQSSLLERLRLEEITPEECLLLVESLPDFRRLKSIRFSLCSASKLLKGRILRALRRNGSLECVLLEAPFFDATDYGFIRNCTCRNALMPGMIEGAATSEGSTSINIVPLLFASTFSPSAAVNPTRLFAALLRLGVSVGDTF